MFIVDKNPKSISAEAYRALRTNIKYSSFDKTIQSLVITSSIPGEGKSTTSGNLAISMAQDGKDVILIDCDLRKPSIHKKFRISNLKGLSDILLEQSTIEEGVIKHASGLHIITSGKIPPNPSEMLGSRTMHKLIESLKINYQYIILDSPPINAVTDSQILSTMTDGTILVVKASSTKKDMVDYAIKELKKTNANIIGIVLNAVEESNKKYNYYYGEKQ
ncbi:CpsD/CapB family tyrosine-protein kinase [Clostridium tarantellae]|uniref:non-specific protein-tyrosine kinase n=1 Tax=Clostridium tarantellae TaxID=39493 RepID=A0A6I1ML84_9CLOT|nr:CpsD/CapB family tyrosine-protein kinase [Clostridium tarantellae]MPQ43503.1 polysaccharide biosynthesis tyrosine autokinase [Clostridium tarantellae]